MAQTLFCVFLLENRISPKNGSFLTKGLPLFLETLSFRPFERNAALQVNILLTMGKYLHLQADILKPERRKVPLLSSASVAGETA